MFRFLITLLASAAILGAPNLAFAAPGATIRLTSTAASDLEQDVCPSLERSETIAAMGPLGLTDRTPPFARVRSKFGAPNRVRYTDARSMLLASWYGPRAMSTVFRRGHGARTFVMESARLTGTAWRTSTGLRIGDQRKVLAEDYPTAMLHAGSGWWLGSYCNVQADEALPALTASMRGGKVTAFGIYPLDWLD